MEPIDYRKLIFEKNKLRLKELAHRALLSGLQPYEFLIVCIDVDDPGWTPLANHLMPNENWQQYRDRGERPIARCSVIGPLRDDLAEAVPGIADDLYGILPDGAVRAVVLGAGGATLWLIEPIPERH